jgi:GR25 family glycosyltransferase involved in LPS biosynthesis
MNHIKEILSDIPIYWINLDRSKNRRDKLEKILNNNNLKNKRIEAVDGKNLDINEIKKNHKIINIKKNELTNAIGCTMSHIKAIKAAYNDGLEYVIIIEDDCNFEYLNYKKIPLKELVKDKDDCEIIILNPIAKNKINIKIIKSGERLNKISCWGAGAYFINRIGMENVITKFEKNKIFKVADALIYEYANTYVSIPYFTYYYAKDNDSTIRNDTKNLSFQDKNKMFWDNFFGVHYNGSM